VTEHAVNQLLTRQICATALDFLAVVAAFQAATTPPYAIFNVMASKYYPCELGDYLY